MINIKDYPGSFIAYVNENIEDLAVQEAELSGEDVADIIIDDWQKGKYENIENEIEIWFEHFELDGLTNNK